MNNMAITLTSFGIINITTVIVDKLFQMFRRLIKFH